MTGYFTGETANAAKQPLQAEALGDTTADNAAAKLFDIAATGATNARIVGVGARANTGLGAGVSGTISFGPAGTGTETTLMRILAGEMNAAEEGIHKGGYWTAEDADDIYITWAGGAGAATDVDFWVHYEGDDGVTIS